MRASRIFDKQIEALLEVNIRIVRLLTAEPQARFMQQRGEVVALEWKLLRLLETELQAWLLKEHLDDLVVPLHDSHKRWRELPGCAIGSNAQIDGLMLKNQLNNVRCTFDGRHFQKLSTFVFKALSVVTATLFEGFEIRFELVFTSLNDQTHHKLWINVLNLLLG